MYNITSYVRSHGFSYYNLIFLLGFPRKLEILHSLVLQYICIAPKIYSIMIAMFETTFDFPLLLVNNKHLQSTKKFPTEVIELFSVVGGKGST